MRFSLSVLSSLLTTLLALPARAEDAAPPRWSFAAGDEFEFTLNSKLRYDSTIGGRTESRVSELKMRFRFAVARVDDKGVATGGVKIVESAGTEEEAGDGFYAEERSYKRGGKALADFKAEGTMDAAGNFALPRRALEPLFGVEDPDIQVARMMLAWPASSKEGKAGWVVPGIRRTPIFPLLEIPGFEMKLEETKPGVTATGKPQKIDWDGKSERGALPPAESKGAAVLEADAATGTTTCSVSDEFSWSYVAGGFEGQGDEKISVKETFESTVTVKLLPK
ncbi:MAG: hypothetical protein HYY18_00625 [Planctomycetes bacterium]|nr:hypothetical protein [Planctomycetota bacterium]